MVTKTPTSQYREVWRTAFHSQLNTTIIINQSQPQHCLHFLAFWRENSLWDSSVEQLALEPGLAAVSWRRLPGWSFTGGAGWPSGPSVTNTRVLRENHPECLRRDKGCDVAGQSYLTFVAQSFFAASWSSVCLDIRVTLTEIFGDTCNFGPKIYKNLLAQDWSVGIRKNGFSFHCALTIINKERYRVTDQRKVPTKLKCEYRG